jgi:hypothetical protein
MRGINLSRNKKPSTPSSRTNQDLDQARDDLFNYIHRCGVLRSTPEDQVEWMDDTIEYLGECYPSLSREQLGELRTMGLRFCRPVIDNVQVETAPAEVEGEPGEASAAAA